jgi:release factor glutamine methyltransferase
MPCSVKGLLYKATKLLKKEGRDATREARILLGFMTKKDKLWMMTHENDVIHDDKAFFELVQRRIDDEPIEYITNQVSFYSQEFYAAKGALIARPETELLIDKVLEELDKDFDGHIVEVGVGSGVISIVLAQHLEKATFSAVDISADAIAVAKVNIERFKMEDRIKLYEGDLLSPIQEKIDVLVSNPPYIEEGVLLEQPLAFEPQNALFGGTIGDEILKRLIDESEKQEITLVACEMGYDQLAPLEEYIGQNTHYEVEFYKDLAQHDRGFVMRYKGK